MTRNPTRIGRYEIITALATGGMGRVYLARATGLGGFERKVVLKTLEVPLTAESDPAIAMFLDEARLLGLLHHQHIASVFEVGRDDDGRHYMVIDYVEGDSAHDLWERVVQLGAALPLDFTLTVVSAAANALHYTHTRKDPDGTPLGIVHRDVTPSNVMIGHDGAVKLIDFGIAMAAGRKTKTQTGFVKGKVSYLSPEQIAGRDVDARTDVFALGILLYELSTMHRAFRDSSDLSTMQRIKAGRVTRPSLLVPNYPLELEILVMKALQVDPRERFGDADEMRRAVEALGHRLHLVLGDAAILEVMAQLYEPGAPAAAQPAPGRGTDPGFDWTDSEHDLTVRRDPDELIAMLRENAAGPARPRGSGQKPAEARLEMPAVRPRKLRAATEAADALIVQSSELPALVVHTPVATPSGVTNPADAAAVARPAVAKPARAKPASARPSGAKPAGAAPGAPAPGAPGIVPSLAVERPIATSTASRLIGASLVEARSRASGRSTRLRWIGAVALVAIAVPAAYVVTRDKTRERARATPTAPAAPAAASVPPPPAPAPAPAKSAGSAGSAAAAAPSQVRVRIVTHPGDATVLLDNKKLGHTPFDETVEADPGKHVFKLRHRGYAVHRLEVTLDADIAQDITLTPQR